MLEPDDDFDRRIRDWLQPDQQTVERVKARALSTQPRRQRIERILALSAVAGLLVALAGMWFWRPASTDFDVFTATFNGDVLVIRATDGTTWILGPESGNQPPAGTGQVVYQGDQR